MKKPSRTARVVATGFAALSLLGALPARAETAPGGDIAGAEKLRRLDIMLMVTGLRCRSTGDDFQADFQAFEARHMPELNAASRVLIAEYSAANGAVAATRMLDRISVQIANQYGNGHPWLGCHDLKLLAQRLAAQGGRESLMAAASETLEGSAPAQPAPGQ